MKKYGVIIGAVVIVLLIVVLIINLPSSNPSIPDDSPKTNNELKELLDKKINHDKLVNISYSNSGNSNGNIDRIDIDLNELTLKTEYKENYSDPLEIKEYKINEEDLIELISYIEEYNFIAWADLQIDRDNIVLDAPLKTVSLTYDNSNINLDNKTYTISFNTKIPREGLPLLKNLVDKIISLKTNATLVSEYSSIDEKK